MTLMNATTLMNAARSTSLAKKYGMSYGTSTGRSWSDWSGGYTATRVYGDICARVIEHDGHWRVASDLLDHSTSTRIPKHWNGLERALREFGQELIRDKYFALALTGYLGCSEPNPELPEFEGHQWVNTKRKLTDLTGDDSELMEMAQALTPYMKGIIFMVEDKGQLMDLDPRYKADKCIDSNKIDMGTSWEKIASVYGVRHLFHEGNVLAAPEKTLTTPEQARVVLDNYSEHWQKLSEWKVQQAKHARRGAHLIKK